MSQRNNFLSGCKSRGNPELAVDGGGSVQGHDSLQLSAHVSHKEAESAWDMSCASGHRRWSNGSSSVDEQPWHSCDSSASARPHFRLQRRWPGTAAIAQRASRHVQRSGSGRAPKTAHSKTFISHLALIYRSVRTQVYADQFK